VSAAKAERWSICSRLLEEGHKPANQDIVFAFLKAAALGQEHAVASLLDAGVCQVQPGTTPAELRRTASLAFRTALEKKQLGVCCLLLQRKAPVPLGTLTQALGAAARNTQGMQLLQLLLDADENVDAVIRHGYSNFTPLHNAIINFNVQAISLLLEYGASLRPAQDSTTPLHDAVRYRSTLRHSKCS
jgi:ankyrin repeat protein